MNYILCIVIKIPCNKIVLYEIDMKKIFKQSSPNNIAESTCGGLSEENKEMTENEKVLDLASIQTRLRECIAESRYTQR